jgi:hypothetical protein
VKKLLLPLLLLAFALPTWAQLQENFSDGDFTQTPTWTGDVAGFQVSTQQLQSNGPAVTGTTLQLVTPVQTAGATTWEFWVNLKLATSSGNYADVWLASEQADLRATGNRGYFVRLGGTLDEVALFRRDATGSPVYVINGVDATLNSSTNNLVRVRVTRSAQDVWTLERDLTGGATYVSEGTATDATLRRGAYFGVQLTYSATNNRAFYFDDFRVTDTTAPVPLAVSVVAARQLNVTFNEPVAATQAASNYRLTAAGAPAMLTAQRDATDPTLVHLALAADLPIGASTLEIRNPTDLYGNTATGPFAMSLQNNGIAAQPALNQLLITEILADETPTVGLPACEYVEIHNPSATTTLDLAGVRLLKPSSSSPAVFPAGAVLLPGEYAVVCGSTRAAQFNASGKVFGLANFPSLTNAADQLLLRGRNGQTLFEVSYSDTWYKDSRKKDGGWSLELVDTGNPCAGLDNWTASTDASGGTPGRANSVRTTNADRTAPKLLRALALNATTVRLFYVEKLDSVAATNPALYSLTPAAAITRAAPVGPDFRMVDLTLSAPLPASQPVTVTVQRATDCVGNAIGQATSATFGLPVPVAAGDVVVNEILFNPRTNAVDFVELLNRSTKYLDVQGWHLGNEKPDGTLDQEIISNNAYVLAPGQLLLLTTRPDIVQSQYPTSVNPETFLPMTSLPTYPDDAGTVVVTDAQGRLLDRYAYAEEQHLKLLDDMNGVSLERLRADAPSVASNFHSAASAAGYATPGRANSQLQQDPGGSQQFKLAPEVFTPDEDGQQDYTTLNYTLDSPGYAASVTVYDAQGRLARRLVRNETLATSGFFQWDGLTDRGQKAAVGYYILLIELFKPNTGEKREYKKTVVLGARF